jgi:hypothetical protein
MAGAAKPIPAALRRGAPRIAINIVKLPALLLKNTDLESALSFTGRLLALAVEWRSAKNTQFWTIRKRH